MSPRHFMIALLILATVISGVSVVYARHLHRQAYVKISTLEKQRDELNIEFSRLQLEQATWSETNRIEQIATERLRMGFPQDIDVVVVRP
jgi:cell division protein FtsL